MAKMQTEVFLYEKGETAHNCENGPEDMERHLSEVIVAVGGKIDRIEDTDSGLRKMNARIPKTEALLFTLKLLDDARAKRMR